MRILHPGAATTLPLYGGGPMSKGAASDMRDMTFGRSTGMTFGRSTGMNGTLVEGPGLLNGAAMLGSWTGTHPGGGPRTCTGT
eukprot:362606-Chlamydomonas_euryale.AAC.6